MNFDALKEKDWIIEYTRGWFKENGKDCNAVVAISGGADSSIVAALMVEALGEDRVLGVLMPDGEQSDLQDAIDLVEHIGIKYAICDIKDITITTKAAISLASYSLGKTTILSEQCATNIAPRIRMMVARGIAQNNNGRYINTCNLSENYIGYFTVDGDGTGDFSPLGEYTKTEVKEIGRLLLPSRFVDKTPHAGLADKCDEDDFGFSYDVLDKYIRTGKIDDEEIKKKIDERHRQNLFKLRSMVTVPYYSCRGVGA